VCGAQAMVHKPETVCGVHICAHCTQSVLLLCPVCPHAFHLPAILMLIDDTLTRPLASPFVRRACSGSPAELGAPTEASSASRQAAPRASKALLCCCIVANDD